MPPKTRRASGGGGGDDDDAEDASPSRIDRATAGVLQRQKSSYAPRHSAPPTTSPRSSGAADIEAMMDPTSPRGERAALAPARSEGEEEPVWVHYYQKHGGKMRFGCGGRVMIGPSIDNAYMLFAWVAILAPSAAYWGWAKPILVEEWGWRLPLSAASLFVATMVSMLATMFTDPGFLMKNAQKGPAVKPRQDQWGRPIGPPAREWIQTQIGTYPFTWCITCDIWRPPYAHHCVDCGHCVLGFDHHCPFVNNCIGVRNHVYFFAFISSVCGLGVVVLAGTLAAMYIQAGRAADEHVALSDDTQMLILGSVAVPVTLLTLVLIFFVCFHIYICCKASLADKEREAKKEGAAAGTKNFCKSRKKKKAGGAGARNYAAVDQGGAAGGGGAGPPATPQRHANHPMRAGVSRALGKEVLALDGGQLSGVVGWELSDGEQSTKLCMPRLMQPRRVVRRITPPGGHDSAD